MFGHIARKSGIALGAMVLGAFAVVCAAAAVETQDLMLGAFAAAASLGVSATIWNGLLGRSIAWAFRWAALIVLTVAIVTVHAWLQLDDVFMNCRGTSSQAPGTIWKLVLIWVLGGCAISGVLFGSVLEAFATRRLRDLGNPLNCVWWAAQGAWVSACIAVLVQNITVEIAKNSLFTAMGATFSIAITVAVIVGIIAAIIWITSAPARKRGKTARLDFDALSDQRRMAIREVVQRHARSCTEQTIYLRVSDTGTWDANQPHIGGGAVLPLGETWPVDCARRPMGLLLQLALPEILGEPWSGKHVAVWASTNEEAFHVRLYGGHAELVEIQQPLDVPEEAASPKRALEALLLPVNTRTSDDDDNDDDDDDDVCAILVETAPGLQQMLAELTTQPELVLAKVLTNNSKAEALESWDAVWVGGTPGLIQSEHFAHCTECGLPMRFLLSSGDFTEGMLMGDAGVLYLYGCDAHPHALQWFVDCH